MERNQQAEKALTRLLDALQEYIDVVSEAYFTAAQRVSEREAITLAKGGVNIAKNLMLLTKAMTQMANGGRQLFDVVDLMQAGEEEISFMEAFLSNQERDVELIEGEQLKAARKRLIASAEFLDAVVQGRGGFA